MMRATHGLLTLSILLASAACTSAAARAEAAGGPGTRSTLITREEIQQRAQYSNLYDVVANLRPRWLRSQGPDTFMPNQGQVQVHMDGNLLGSVEELRRIPPLGVTSIEWVAPIAAAAQFGLDHSHGAIVVSSKPVP